MHTYLSAHPVQSHAFETAKHQADGAPKPDGGPSYGLITIAVEHFNPKNARSTPPSITDGMGIEVGRAFAIAYNASAHARKKRRWAVVVHSGTMLIIAGIKDDERPADPTSFPSCVISGYTRDEAGFAMEVENEERHRLARIPRAWTIAVCPLVATEGTVSQ